MEKFWEWAYREVYLDKKRPWICIKKLKTSRTKNFFWITIDFPQRIYTILKFWIKDFNKYEYWVLRKAQKLIPENTPEYIEMTDEWLIESLVKNYDWSISKSLKNFEWKLWVEFFDRLMYLITYLYNNGIELFDIVWNNILVQEYERWKYRPILFDFKRIWWRTYICQPWLLFSQKARDNKLYRRLDKLREIIC